MSQKRGLLDTITRFIFGPPVSVSVANTDQLDLIRELSQKLDSVTQRLPEPGVEQSPSGPPTESEQLSETLADLSKQVSKLAKTQFKANTLQEAQQAQQKEALDHLEQALTQQEKLRNELIQQQQQAIEAAQLAVLKEMLPVIDSLDAAFNVGRRQVLKLPMEREVQQAIVAWLDGIRLARLRILDVFAAHDITPIPTVGHLFDPHYHIAVATENHPDLPENQIIGQDRTGYATPAKVLREAEVVVARRQG